MHTSIIQADILYMGLQKQEDNTTKDFRCPEILVNLNHPLIDGFSIIIHPASGGTPIYGNYHLTV